MPIDPTPEGGEILHQPVVKPFTESTPNNEEQDKHQEEPETSNEGQLEGALAADADILGEAVPLKPPVPEAERSVPGTGTGATPAEDENQPGFIGERNLPHS